MTTRAITVESTSRDSAICNDIILRENDGTRLIFKPLIINNKNNPKASVKGTFVYQRKGKNETWENVSSEPLSKVKQGESIKLDLRSGEVSILFENLSALYKIHESDGIRWGHFDYVPIRSGLRSFAEATLDQVDEVLREHDEMGANALNTLLSWATRTGRIPEVAAKLTSLDAEAVQKLSAASRLAELSKTRDEFAKNRNNTEEEFWQDFLAERAYILEQILRFPAVLIKGKAYVGGKSVFNSGGGIVDFLIKNPLTHNCGLIEIKTPATPLLGKEYRNGIYSASPELNGAVVQVLTYRDSLTKEFYALRPSSGAEFDVLNPECIIIAGRARTELANDEKKRSFELFRSHLSNVRIVTFDEVYYRLQSLIKLLGG